MPVFPISLAGKELIMANKRRQDITRTQPLTLAALREYGELDGFRAPGSFAPDGQWKHTYRIWLVNRRDYGFLSIERRPSSDGGSVTLDVEVSVQQAAGTVHQTRSRIQCADNALSTPQSWEIESEILSSDLQPIEVTRVREDAKVKGGKLSITAAGRSLNREIPAVFTSNWSLFDAVQRLPGKEAPTLEFALLEDLDLLKQRQRLSYWQSTGIDIGVDGGDSLQLTGYQQIGAGILPYQYWVDDQHRLLFAISGIRAYIFAPNAQKDMEQRLQKLARRKS
jgi:hypothetical protein